MSSPIMLWVHFLLQYVVSTATESLSWFPVATQQNGDQCLMHLCAKSRFMYLSIMMIIVSILLPWKHVSITTILLVTSSLWINFSFILFSSLAHQQLTSYGRCMSNYNMSQCLNFHSNQRRDFHSNRTVDVYFQDYPLSTWQQWHN